MFVYYVEVYFTVSTTLLKCLSVFITYCTNIWGTTVTIGWGIGQIAIYGSYNSPVSTVYPESIGYSTGFIDITSTILVSLLYTVTDFINF